MALLNCIECGKEISDKASSCPNCGNPMNNEASKHNSKKNDDLLICPELPNNLEIGKQIVNWGGDAGFDGIFDSKENTINELSSGKIKVILHTHGIQLMQGLTFYSIHQSQIISLKQTSQEELVKKGRSVVGRAVVGGLILGPLGAIVGGMSGIGDNEQLKNKHYLIINFWDEISRTAQTFLISGDKKLITSFIGRFEEEKLKNASEGRVAEKETISPLTIIVLVIIVISVLVMILT